MKKVTMKKKPTGFIAICQCGVIIGALDLDRTGRKEAGQIMVQWLHDGCKVIPKFDSSWEVTCSHCVCPT